MITTRTLKPVVVSAKSKTASAVKKQKNNPFVDDLMLVYQNKMKEDLLKQMGLLDDENENVWLRYAVFNPLNAILQNPYLYRFENGKDLWINKKDEIVRDYLNSSNYNNQKSFDLYSRYKKTKHYRNAWNEASAKAMDDGINLSDLRLDRQFDDWITNTRKGRRISRKYDRQNVRRVSKYAQDMLTAMDYVDSYYQSRGINSSKDRPNVKLTTSAIGQSNYNPSNNTITHGMNLANYNKVIPYIIGAHEYAHYYDKYDHNNNSSYPLTHQMLFDQRNKDNLSTEVAYDQHDSSNAENYADLIASKAAMAKYGIYDSTKNAPITLKLIRKYRKKYGDFDRFFRMYDDDVIKSAYELITQNPGTIQNNIV